MPRPKKERKIHKMPSCKEFGPLDSIPKEEVIMTMEEYETIRLIDKRGFTQEECCQYMNVARTTVQQIYNDARYKLSLALIDGRKLIIDGGHYVFCQRDDFCGFGQRCRGRNKGQGRGRMMIKRLEEIQQKISEEKKKEGGEKNLQ